MIPLDTERLHLRAARESDLDFVKRLHSNPDMVRFIPSAAEPDDEKARDQLVWFMTLIDDPVQGFSVVELRETGEAVALIMVKPLPPSGGGKPTMLEIGWRQVAEHCGNGYVTEAAKAVLDEATNRTTTSIFAVTDPENTASQGVAERIGMQPLGLTHEFYDREATAFVAHPGR